MFSVEDQRRKDRAVDTAVYAYTRRQHERAEDQRAFDHEGQRQRRTQISDINTAEQINESGVNPIRIRH